MSDDEEVAKNTRSKKVKRDDKKSYKTQFDTNIFQIELGTLQNQAELATGDPYFCKECKSVFNMYSKVNDNNKWKCEFCMTENDIDIDEEEKPKTDDVKYIIEAGQNVATQKDEKMTSET